MSQLNYLGVSFLMDFYCEQLVTKTRTAGDTLKIVLSVVISALIAAVCVFFIFLTGALLLLILAFAAVGAGLWIAAGVGVEYEYIITNDEMDIDKIIGKRKRKRMITVEISRTMDFLPISQCDNDDFDVVVQASGGLEEHACCMFVEHSGYGKVKIVFDPDKRTREAIARSVPKQLSEKVVNRNG